MQLIETVTVPSGGQASITFASIPDSFTDLCVVLSGRSSKAADSFDVLELSFNSNTSNRSSRRVYGNGATTTSDSFTNGRIGLITASSATTNAYASTRIYVSNYRSAVAKSALIDNVSETNATTSFQELFAFLWNDTSVISSLTLDLSGGDFVQHTVASLYGILAGSDGVTSVS